MLSVSLRELGVWPAVWLTGARGDHPPEVDIFEYNNRPHRGEFLSFNVYQDADPEGGDVIQRPCPDVGKRTEYRCVLELVAGTADVRVTYFMGGRELGAHVGVEYANREMDLIANMQMTPSATVEEAWMEIHSMRVARWAA